MPSLPTDPRRRATLVAAAVAVVCAGVVAVVLTGTLTPAPAPAPAPSATRAAVPSATTTVTPSPSASARPTDPAAVDAPASTTIAAASGPSVPVSAAPGGPATDQLANPLSSGAPLVFRVVDQRDGWVQVQLAQRPNGSTGWVPDSAVSLSTTDYAIVVTEASNTLDLYRAGEVVDSYPVATGTGGTPTPTGRFALTELLAPTNDGYGPYAYGTTAFSDVLNSFGGGPGQIGLHGTDDATSIGTDASHGCIRMRNADITALAGRLPLGTPIQVR
ncbi:MULTISPECIES: L,D-transpeptidase family protein [unclassified Curtobacterium]|uniref:L,D-transpeptidase family protein n=1 Tax=unclassified Curtobacterium TaxID=257496 RepID=UPI0021ABBC88|nr:MULTISPECIES: L,D-transpeptidase family protein [unclassified Curtobacterium]WIB36310.1 L,D-transpeptidase family protein [Curtobacterium sp. MCJR17_043]